jgi:hypothetical protein
MIGQERIHGERSRGHEHDRWHIKARINEHSPKFC